MITNMFHLNFWCSSRVYNVLIGFVRTELVQAIFYSGGNIIQNICDLDKYIEKLMHFYYYRVIGDKSILIDCLNFFNTVQ